MKRIPTCFLIICIFSLFVGCKKNPFVPEERIEEIRDSIAALKSIQNICFIYNNDVYFLDEISNTPQRITSTPTNIKTEVRISHNLQKIAYLNSAGNPEIIDRNGAVLNILTAYSGIQQMDWSNDDATLYMLSGNSFYYYGPTISHPLLNFSGIPGSTSPYILSATLSKDNDLAYVVEYFDFSVGYVQKLILKKNDGSGTWVVVSGPWGKRMSYVKFSTNAKDLIVGYDEPASSSLSTLELYTDLKSYPDQTIQYCTSCQYNYAIYRSDKKCIVSAFQDASGATATDFFLSAYFINDVTFKNRTEYNNSTSELIIDWK